MSRLCPDENNKTREHLNKPSESKLRAKYVLPLEEHPLIKTLNISGNSLFTKLMLIIL